MSYLTLKVQIDNGQVVLPEPYLLPAKATGLLTILQADEAAPAMLTPLQALEALQRQLKLNEQAAAEWMTSVQAARR